MSHLCFQKEILYYSNDQFILLEDASFFQGKKMSYETQILMVTLRTIPFRE